MFEVCTFNKSAQTTVMLTAQVGGVLLQSQQVVRFGRALLGGQDFHFEKDKIFVFIACL